MRSLIVGAVALMIVGCSSSPKVVAEKPQYCFTSQTILTKNGEQVQSETLVECTDDQIKRIAQKRLGSSPNCGEFTYWMKIGGRDVQRKGISCQKPDGSWEIINTTGY
jgi:hypothetical protein